MDLQLLSDRVEIIDLMNRYALSVDLRDWAGYRSCFADEIELDMSSPGWPDKISADEWVDRIRAGIMVLDATQHQMSNHTINVDGDQADSITYVRATHHLPSDEGDSQHTIVGYYNNKLIRTEQGWKIRRFNLTNLWNEGNLYLRELMAQARNSVR